MTATHELADPGSAYVGSETVTMTTLDDLKHEIMEPDERASLKVDVQGSEQEVLSAGEEVLSNCRLVELELGFAELYEKQALFGEQVEWMHERDLVLTDLEPAFRRELGSELLQVDALFARID